MKYWLFKSEPNAYSIEDLEKEKSTSWDGVRNYQARNFMRDQMKVGDMGLFYHSNAKPPGVVGICKVCKEAHQDHTAFDEKSRYYDPKSSLEKPTWMMVDVQFIKKFSRLIPLEELKEIPGLEGMVLLQKGSRLSIQPVEKKHFNLITKL